MVRLAAAELLDRRRIQARAVNPQAQSQELPPEGVGEKKSTKRQRLRGSGRGGTSGARAAVGAARVWVLGEPRAVDRFWPDTLSGRRLSAI